MSLISCIILSTIIAWFLLRPHFEIAYSTEDNLAQGSADSLIDQKKRVVQMLRDLELDYSTSKLNMQDYEQTKHELSIELAKLLKQIDESNG